MKYVGENSIKKLISFIKGDLNTKQDSITATGVLERDTDGAINGVETVSATLVDTQEATLVDVPNGLLKGDGTTISAAVAGTDYQAPLTAGTDYQTPLVAGTDYQAPLDSTITKTMVIEGEYADDGSIGITTTISASDVLTAINNGYYPILKIKVNSSGNRIYRYFFKNDNKSFYFIGNYLEFDNANDIISNKAVSKTELILLKNTAEGSISWGGVWPIGTDTIPNSDDDDLYLYGGGLLAGWTTVSDLIENGNIATKDDMTTAIQSAIQNTWEASY